MDEADVGVATPESDLRSESSVGASDDSTGLNKLDGSETITGLF
jgi:hypothetical protein